MSMNESKSLLELVDDEMRERLENPARRSTIPDYTLAQMHKALEKTETPTSEVETEERDTVEVILSLGLPEEKKRELLAEELTKVYERRQQILDAIEVLNAGEEQEAAEGALREVR